MNKINIQRLLHTLLPFLIMTMIQRSLMLLFGQLGLTGETAQLCAFLPAAAVCVLVFRIRTYTPADEENDTESVPLEKKPLFPTALRTLQACALMIAAMFAVSAVLGGEAEETDFTVLRVLSLLVIYPVTEEILFRKLFYGELRLMHPVFGVVAQALMFAIVHHTVGGMIYALASGIVLGILCEQTGRLRAVIAAHCIINLRSLLCLTVLAQRTGLVQIIDGIIIIAGALSFVAQTILDNRIPIGEETDGENDAQS
ncbi:MAG: CPBP family intramembrane metalloprotease [Clostridia bacterium]|nr:CPBP family intramembrane metalloprotease [Clostridia bacterium]